ncbi:MAG: protein kinase [Planctomycetes bacterium]|nr:protein kinase [Planctomycetota bacterium]
MSGQDTNVSPRAPSGSLGVLRPGKSATAPATFGQIVLELGLLTPEQLEQALILQRERSRAGDFARLGHILVDGGFLTPEQVLRVLSAQRLVILACSGCKAQFNVQGYVEDARYQCPSCHAVGSLHPADPSASVAVQDQLQAAPPSGSTVRLKRTEHTDTTKIHALRTLGNYEILGEIARGGMGIIYKARQLDLDRIVALKTLRQEELRSNPDAGTMFRDEARAVALLRHPNIVAVHEVGAHDGIEFFTMDFVAGLSLDRLILRRRLDPREAVEIVIPIAEALQYAHRAGVVHRDLKPANIIVDDEGVPFLVDWGIASRIDSKNRPAVDEEEDLLGSIPYMAPEYVEGAAYDELCDLYSLGVVLYEAVAGANCLPHYDDDTRRFLERIMCDPPVPIESQVRDLDPALAEIIGRAIAPRAERTESMHDFVAALRRWLVAHDVKTGADSSATTRPLGRRPSRSLGSSGEPPPNALWIAGALLALCALVGGGWHVRGRIVALEWRAAQAEHEALRRVLEANFRSAQLLEEQGRLREAVQVLTSAIPDSVEAHATPELAQVLRLRGKLRRALKQAGADEDLIQARRIDGR